MTQLTSEGSSEEQLLLLKFSLAAGTESPSLTSAPLFFLTYLDIFFFFHRGVLTCSNLVLGMGVAGLGWCGGLAWSDQV